MNFPLIIVFDNIPRMISFCYFPYILHSHLIFHFGKSFHFDISKFCKVLFLCWFISFTRKFSHALFLLGLFSWLGFGICIVCFLWILAFGLLFSSCSVSFAYCSSSIVCSFLGVQQQTRQIQPWPLESWSASKGVRQWNQETRLWRIEQEAGEPWLHPGTGGRLEWGQRGDAGRGWILEALEGVRSSGKVLDKRRAGTV